jgi:hypothetical protein
MGADGSPSPAMPNDPSPDEKLGAAFKEEAGQLLSKMSEVEAVLQLLSPRATYDDSVARLITERLDGLNVLRFVSLCTLFPEDVAASLQGAGVDDQSIGLIKTFAMKYAPYGSFLRRLQRAGQGFVNELTGSAARPALNLLNNEVVLEVKLQSHDRVVLTAKDSLDGWVLYISSLLRQVNKAIESLKRVAPSTAPLSLDPKTVDELVETVHNMQGLMGSSDASKTG